MARHWLLIGVVFIFWLSAGLAGAAEMELFKAERFQGGPWRIRAETLTYDANNHVYLAEGKVEINQADRRITADRVQVDEVTKVARLSGNVVIVLGDDVFTGKEGQFNLATRGGELHGARLYLKRNNFHVDSALIRRTGDNTYYAEEAKVTTCDADRPVWSFSVRQLSVMLEGYATAKDAKVNLAGVPLLRLPLALLPMMSERQSGFLLPSYGQHKAGGTVVETPFYWAMSNNADATLFQTVLSNRGYMQGAEFRRLGHNDAAANFRFFYLDDGKANQLTDHRFWAAGMVNQPLPEDWNLRLTVDRVSDVNYLKDFNFGYMGLNRYSRELLQGFGRGLEQEDVNTRVSTYVLSRNFSWANLTSYGRYYERLNSADPNLFNRLPGLELNSLQLPLGGLPLYFGLGSSYNYFQQNHGMNGDRLDLHPQLSLQGQPLSALSFNSRVGFRETMFRIDHNVPDGPPEGFVGRQLFDSRVGVSSSWARDYGREEGASNFVRHIIRPEVTYWNIPRYDPRRYPSFDPFDQGWVARANRNLPIRDGDDPIGGVNALTYGISNDILRRGANAQGQAAVKDLIWLRLSQSSFFNHSSMGLDGTSQPHHPFSDFLGEMEVYPMRQVTLGLNMGVSPYNEGFDRADFKVTVLDAKRQNYLSVNYIFINDFAKQINVETYLNLMQSLKTWLTYGHTFETNKQLEKKYGIILQQQCWGVALSYTERPDDKRVGFTVFLPGFGEKMKRSPVRFPDEAKTKESPDLF
ncbi:MAG: LPS assembly protein LptD [Deltaproteobacteria bacterium]|nr:LPS assembly protein LptD [Deltaproteobacteria bacterium]